MKSPLRQALPLVSVVVPTFNQAAYLPSCLDSILHQEYPSVEIIVVNDASPDETGAVVARYLEELDAVHEPVVGYRQGRLLREKVRRFPSSGRSLRYLENERNLGATAAYNRGFSASTGRYITFVPSDDILLPHHLRCLVQALLEGCHFAYSDFFLVDDDLRILADYRQPSYDFERCLADWYRLGPSHLFEKSLYERHGGFDPGFRFANDYDLFLRFAMGGARFRHVSQVLYLKRCHDERRTGQWAHENYEELIGESVRCAERARAWLRRKDA